MIEIPSWAVGSIATVMLFVVGALVILGRKVQRVDDHHEMLNKIDAKLDRALDVLNATLPRIAVLEATKHTNSTGSTGTHHPPS